jgi:hypothetical protein
VGSEPVAGAAGGCGRRLGTGHDDDVARTLHALQDATPRDRDAYLRNVRDAARVAEADLAIAAARMLHLRGELVHGRAGTAVRLRTSEGRRAGQVVIEPAEGKGELHLWRFSADVPEGLAAEMARIAPAWVAVEQDRPEGAVTLRAARRRRPPPQWTRRLPQLRKPEGYR